MARTFDDPQLLGLARRREEGFGFVERRAAVGRTRDDEDRAAHVVDRVDGAQILHCDPQPRAQLQGETASGRARQRPHSHGDSVLGREREVGEESLDHHGVESGGLRSEYDGRSTQ